MFQCWFNCAFFEPNGVMVIEKNMLDTACKVEIKKKLLFNFKIQIKTYV